MSGMIFMCEVRALIFSVCGHA